MEQSPSQIQQQFQRPIGTADEGIPCRSTPLPRQYGGYKFQPVLFSASYSILKVKFLQLASEESIKPEFRDLIFQYCGYVSPVIFVDDSGSMENIDEHGKTRWNHQCEYLRRLFFSSYLFVAQ